MSSPIFTPEQPHMHIARSLAYPLPPNELPWGNKAASRLNQAHLDTLQYGYTPALPDPAVPQLHGSPINQGNIATHKDKEFDPEKGHGGRNKEGNDAP
eukprot:1161643-Pelagomonas_calceolata.AAC.10